MAHQANDRTDKAEERRTEDGPEPCPECGAPTVQERCKVVCRSARCTYRIIYNCSEF